MQLFNVFEGCMMLTVEQINDLFVYKGNNLYWRLIKKAHKKCGLAGSVNNKGYRQVIVKGKAYLCHRLIFKMHHGVLPKFIDHIDGDPSNNSIENLRECTKSQNCLNQKISNKNTSGVKGVSWSPTSKKWRVDVAVDKKQRYLGVFDDLELASLVADEARSLYHGEFARCV